MMSASMRLRTILRSIGIVAALAVVCLAALVWLLNDPPRTYRAVGGGWYSADEWQVIAESGRKPRFLVRGHWPLFRHDVAQHVTQIHYLGDDCVVYTFVAGRDDDLFSACGNRPPVFLDHVENQDYRNISIDTEPLRLH